MWWRGLEQTTPPYQSNALSLTFGRLTLHISSLMVAGNAPFLALFEGFETTTPVRTRRWQQLPEQLFPHAGYAVPELQAVRRDSGPGGSPLPSNLPQDR